MATLQQKQMLNKIAGDRGTINPAESIVALIKATETMKEFVDRNNGSEKNNPDLAFINRKEQEIEAKQKEYAKYVFEAIGEVANNYNIFDKYEFQLTVIKK